MKPDTGNSSSNTAVLTYQCTYLRKPPAGLTDRFESISNKEGRLARWQEVPSVNCQFNKLT